MTQGGTMLGLRSDNSTVMTVLDDLELVTGAGFSTRVLNALSNMFI